MAELIRCRDCDSPNCKGCNVYILEQALHYGNLDGLKDGNKTIRIPTAGVRENVRGEWEQVTVRNKDHDDLKAIEAVASMRCPYCHRWNNEVYLYGNPTEMANFCPSCGAEMRGEQHE